MTTITKNALKLFDYAVKEHLSGHIGDACKKIGLVQSNLKDIRSGKRSFTHDQLLKLLKVTGASADWVYGLSSNMFRIQEKMTGMQLLEKAVAALKAER